VNHILKAISCFFVALALYVGIGTDDESIRPIWLDALVIAVVATFALQGVRQLLLHCYGEGQRTILIIDAGRHRVTRR
jgi:hypothetical protein